MGGTALRDADRDGRQGLADTAATPPSGALEAWLGGLASRPAFGSLLEIPWAAQCARGSGCRARSAPACR